VPLRLPQKTSCDLVTLYMRISSCRYSFSPCYFLTRRHSPFYRCCRFCPLAKLFLRQQRRSTGCRTPDIFGPFRRCVSGALFHLEVLVHQGMETASLNGFRRHIRHPRGFRGPTCFYPAFWSVSPCPLRDTVSRINPSAESGHHRSCQKAVAYGRGRRS
jgi:hypothetical protein